MRKRIITCFIILAYALNIPSLWAYNESSPFFLELEYFAPADIADGEILSLETAGISGEILTSGASGLKLGYLYQTKNNLNIGISGGYILGPNSEVSCPTFSYDRKVSFGRILGELRTEIPMGEYWKFKPGISAGMAFGKVEYTSVFAIFPSGTSSEETWSGFAWEISAPLIYKDYIFALKYAGFPTVEETDNTKK